MNNDEIKILKEIAVKFCVDCEKISVNYEKCEGCKYAKFFNEIYLRLVKNRRRE